MPTKPTDIELIRQVMRENNSHAFEVLMQHYTPQVYGAALCLMRDKDDAAEVVGISILVCQKCNLSNDLRIFYRTKSSSLSFLPKTRIR